MYNKIDGFFENTCGIKDVDLRFKLYVGSCAGIAFGGVKAFKTIQGLKATYDLRISQKEQDNFLSYGKEMDKKIAEITLAIASEKPIDGKGCLFFGPPGNGKTQMVHKIAKDADAILLKFDWLSMCQAFLKGNYKDGTHAVVYEQMFKRLKKIKWFVNKPIMLFWDELDDFFRKRANTDDRSAAMAVSALLGELQKLKPDSGIYFFGATNSLDILDTALLRYGRVGNLIEFKNPNEAEIFDVLEAFIKNNKQMLPLLSNDDMNKIKSLCSKFLGLPRSAIRGIMEVFCSKLDNKWIGKTLSETDSITFYNVLNASIEKAQESQNLINQIELKQKGYSK